MENDGAERCPVLFCPRYVHILSIMAPYLSEIRFNDNLYGYATNIRISGNINKFNFF